jgi:hypothetical protein
VRKISVATLPKQLSTRACEWEAMTSSVTVSIHTRGMTTQIRVLAVCYYSDINFSLFDYTTEVGIT